MEDDEPLTPFWVQNSPIRRRRGFDLITNSPFFVVPFLIVVMASALLGIAVSVRLLSQILQLHTIKNSWDSLNLVLVIVAIVCWILSRFTSNQRSGNEDREEDDAPKLYPTASFRFSDYGQDQAAYGRSSSSLSRLRSFSSHPDLRRESQWGWSDDERWRFYDDSTIGNFQYNLNRIHDGIDQDSPRLDGRRKHTTEVAEAEVVKDVVHETLEKKDDKAQHYSSQTVPVSGTGAGTGTGTGTQKVHRRRGKKNSVDADNDKNNSNETANLRSQSETYHISTPPPPPPPPPQPAWGRNDKRKEKGTKKKQKLQEAYKLEISEESSLTLQRITPPPPPPPPPQVLHRIVRSKELKSKKIAYTVQPLVKMPFVPPNFTAESKFDMETIDKGLPGSPWRIPPPPPPPPFKLPALKFVRQGDFVRVGSFNSSGSGSSDVESSDELASERGTPVAAEAAAAAFCQSPDVNAKADNFIARVRAGLSQEKTAPAKGMSNLRPSPGYSRTRS